MSARLSLAVVVSALLLAASPADATDRSAGCRVEPPAAPPTRFEVDGRMRAAIVAVPDHVDGTAHALVFAFHGRTNANARVRRYFGLEKAARRPTIFVYPAGLRDDTGGFTWFEPGDAPDGLRDLALFDVLFERLTASYCVDLDAVFVVGHSLGASFAASLACARNKEVRAVAAVAGGIASGTCGGEVAALLIHHPQDRAVPIAEGERARDALLGAGSRGPGQDTTESGFRCARHADARDPLLWCLSAQDRTSRGRFYPHRWPDGAGKAIMRFFEDLPPRG